MLYKRYFLVLVCIANIKNYKTTRLLLGTYNSGNSVQHTVANFYMLYVTSVTFMK